MSTVTRPDQIRSVDAATAQEAPIRLLVIDEYAPIRDVLVTYFGEEGFHASGAATAEEALAAPFALPEVIVLGISHDDLSSLDKMRSAPAFRDTPIVALSSSGGPRVRDEAASHGADAALSKPTLPDEIVQAVRDLVRRQRASRAAGLPIGAPRSDDQVWSVGSANCQECPVDAGQRRNG